MELVLEILSDVEVLGGDGHPNALFNLRLEDLLLFFNFFGIAVLLIISKLLSQVEVLWFLITFVIIRLDSHKTRRSKHILKFLFVFLFSDLSDLLAGAVFAEGVPVDVLALGLVFELVVLEDAVDLVSKHRKVINADVTDFVFSFSLLAHQHVFERKSPGKNAFFDLFHFLDCRHELPVCDQVVVTV